MPFHDMMFEQIAFHNIVWAQSHEDSTRAFWKGGQIALVMLHFTVNHVQKFGFVVEHHWNRSEPHANSFF